VTNRSQTTCTLYLQITATTQASTSGQITTSAYVAISPATIAASNSVTVLYAELTGVSLFAAAGKKQSTATVTAVNSTNAVQQCGTLCFLIPGCEGSQTTISSSSPNTWICLFFSHVTTINTNSPSGYAPDTTGSLSVLVGASAPRVSPLDFSYSLLPNSPLLAPARGFNSWNFYGPSITESQVRQTALFMSQNMASAGYRYVVIDEGWEVSSTDGTRSVDSNGRVLPDPGKYPSSAGGLGFAPLSSYIHSLGLLFGIHVVVGIINTAPAAVLNNLTTGGSFRSEAPFISLNPDPIYTSNQWWMTGTAQQWVDWGVDFVKLDEMGSDATQVVFHQRIISQTTNPNMTISTCMPDRISLTGTALQSHPHASTPPC
jgi:Alpha galactosidase A